MECIPDLIQPISLLLVEDQEVTLELLATILPKKYLNLALHTATNGKTGLELFKSYVPDIVITDINMPEMDGVQMAENIRALKPDTKFIAITGKNENTVLHGSAGNGFEFDHFIGKPVVFEELFEAIEQCIVEIAQQA